MFKKYIGNKKFYKTVFILIIPIMFQQLLVSIAGYIDNIMINNVSDLAFNGVSAANKLMFIITFVCFGLTSGATIFIAQYFGANKKEEVKESIRLSLYASIIFGIVAFFIIMLMGNFVVNSFVQNTESRQFGYDYLNIIKYGVIILSLNIAFASAFRSVKMPYVALVSATTGIVVNVFLNYCLIFGNFGFPELNATGAALATVISRAIELIIFILFVIFSKKIYFKNLFNKIKISSKLTKDFCIKTIPLVLNELLWSFGMVLFTLFLTYKNDMWYNAYGYSQNISDLFFIVFSGLGVGTAVIIGARLGNSEFKEALEEFYYFRGLGIMMGLLVGGLMFLTAPLTARMFSDDANTLELVINLLRVTAVFTAIYCYNAVSFFTLRSGGDSINAFLLDQLPTYIIGLPICIIFGVNAAKWGISIILIYLLVHILDFVKIILGNYFINKKKWIRNLTIDENK